MCVCRFCIFEPSSQLCLVYVHPFFKYLYATTTKAELNELVGVDNNDDQDVSASTSQRSSVRQHKAGKESTETLSMDEFDSLSVKKNAIVNPDTKTDMRDKDSKKKEIRNNPGHISTTMATPTTTMAATATMKVGVSQRHHNESMEQDEQSSDSPPLSLDGSLDLDASAVFDEMDDKKAVKDAPTSSSSSSSSALYESTSVKEVNDRPSRPRVRERNTESKPQAPSSSVAAATDGVALSHSNLSISWDDDSEVPGCVY